MVEYEALGPLLVNRAGAGARTKPWAEAPHANAPMMGSGASVCKELPRGSALQNHVWQ